MWTTPARRVREIGLCGLVAAAGLSAAGCADIGRATGVAPAPIDRSSPVAADVEAASRAHYEMPSFRDVPPPPTGVRPPSDFRAQVAQTVQARDRLQAFVAANPPMVPLDPAAAEAFAAAGRASIPADQAAPVAGPVGSEDYAERLRELAAPPPPPR